MRLIEARWDEFGNLVVRPRAPWPPHESLADLGEREVLYLLEEAVQWVLQPKGSHEVSIDYHERVVRIRKHITQEEARRIAEAFAKKCYEVVRERQAITTAPEDPREAVPLPTEVEPQSEASVEEEAERWRRELDKVLERYRYGVHGS